MEIKDEAILSQLLLTGSVEKTAEAVGCSRGTVYKRLKDDGFKTELDSRRKAVLDGATAALQSAITAAVDTVVSVLQDTKNAAQIRLNAAQIILTNALRYGEQNGIIGKIEKLESLVNQFN